MQTLDLIQKIKAVKKIRKTNRSKIVAFNIFNLVATYPF